MAINTQNRRRSTVCILPVADGVIGAADRRQVVWQYAGLSTPDTFLGQTGWSNAGAFGKSGWSDSNSVGSAGWANAGAFGKSGWSAKEG